jgi:uncharacterized protein (TIGR02266 family)
MSELHTRKEKRTPVTLKIKFKSATLDQFIERYSVDVSHGGIFIRTKDPLAVGTQLRFEFQLQDSSPLISGDGTVVWTREFDPSRVGVAPGMGVRFDRLAPESQPVLEQILQRKVVPAHASHDRFEAAAGSSPGQSTLGEKTRITPPTLASSLAASTRLPSSSGAAARPITGTLAPQRSSFGGEEAGKDSTPLPNPMPFHGPGDDEFSEDVFEQPTKVASLETLLKHEEEHARKQRAAAGAESQDTDPGEDEQTDVSRRVGARASEPPVPVESVDEPVPATAPTVPASRPGEPRFLDAMHRDRAEVRIPSELVKTVPSPARAEAPRAERRSSLPLLLGVLLLLAAAAAVYFLVVAPGSDEEPVRPPPRAATQAAPPAPPAPAPAAQPPAPTPAPVAAPAPVAKGRLAISVTPSDAALTVDGAAASAGTVEVEAGSHTIAARAACFRDGKVDVEVKPGEEKPVAVKLRPLERVVRVTSNPPSAQLLVDNAPAGRTPAEVRLVGRLDPRARHAFTVRRPGFLDTRTVVAPDADCATEGDVGVVSLHLSLTPLRSRPAPRPAPPRPRPATTTTPEPKPTPLIVPPTDPPEPQPEPEKPEPEPAPAPPPAEAPAPRPAPVETAPGSSSSAPAEAKPAEAAPAPKAEPEKKDCDPSPDAPEWARCK